MRCRRAIWKKTLWAMRLRQPNGGQARSPPKASTQQRTQRVKFSKMSLGKQAPKVSQPASSTNGPEYWATRRRVAESAVTTAFDPDEGIPITHWRRKVIWLNYWDGARRRNLVAGLGQSQV